MNTPLISVIVPIYNVEQYLNRCLKSIVKQSYKKLEIILVDDGSTDRCPQICDEWASKDNRIKVIHKKNGGLSDARNYGFEVATGEYIGYVDSDDWIELDMYEILMNVINREKSDIACCSVRKVWEDRDLQSTDYINKLQITSFDTENALKLLIEDNILQQTVWNKLYRKDIIDGISFEVGRFHEDVFWSYRIIGNAKKISIVNIECYNYFQRDNSIMGQGYSLKRLDALDALENRCRYIEKYFPSLSKLAMESYMSSCMYQLQCVFRSKDINIIHKGKSNIKDRIRKEKIKNKYINIDLKQHLWVYLFLICPEGICKFRNKFKIGF